MLSLARRLAAPSIGWSLMSLLALSGCDKGSPEGSDPQDNTATSSSSTGNTEPDEEQTPSDKSTESSSESTSSSETPDNTSDESSSSQDSSQTDSTELPEDVEVKSYHENIANRGYASSIMFYPVLEGQSVLPVVVVMHGWMGSKEKMQWIGERVAQQGFASIVITASNATNLFAQPKDWIKNYEAALASLEDENKRAQSPLHERLDLKKVSLIGHSMGGGGALFYAHANPERLKSTLALAPFSNDAKKEIGEIKAATLILTGSKDTVAPPKMGNSFFEALDDGIVKKYEKLSDVGHNDFEKDGAHHEEIATQVINWLDRHGR